MIRLWGFLGVGFLTVSLLTQTATQAKAGLRAGSESRSVKPQRENVALVAVGAVDRTAVSRVYIQSQGVDEGRVLELRRRLIDSGARNRGGR